MLGIEKEFKLPRLEGIYSYSSLTRVNWGGGGMTTFGNFAKRASLCVDFHLGTLHIYFFSPRLLAKFGFDARISKLVLKFPLTVLIIF